MTILFVCIHNSARSQMAEAFAKQKGIVSYSAGIEPGKLNPIVVESLKEIDIDISKNSTKSVTDIINQKIKFDYVITVCDETNAERCPYIPGDHKRLHWNFTDPSQFKGSNEEKLAQTRKVRDEIRLKIDQFLKTEK